MSIIEKYKTVTVSNYFTISDNFDVDIVVPFPVDEIVIKHVSWIDSQFNPYPKPSDPLHVTFPAIKRMYLLKTDLITNNNFLNVGGESYVSTPDIKYRTGRVFIQSKYNFKICMMNGNNIIFDPTDVDELLDMYISLTLEFRKYLD